MSLMPARTAVSSSRATASRTSSSTAPSRRRMAATLRRGRSSQERSSRAPMAVLVRSSTHRRLPRFSLPRRVAVSSRFRRAFRSSSINRPCS